MNQFDNIDLICEALKQPFISVGVLSGGFTSGKNKFIYLPKFDVFVRSKLFKYATGCNTIDEVKERIKTKEMPIKKKITFNQTKLF